MIDINNYIKVNAPTIAENAIKNLLWYNKNPYETIKQLIEHSYNYYNIPKILFKDEVYNIYNQLYDINNLQNFVKSLLWRVTNVKTVNQYIKKYWCTSLKINDIVQLLQEGLKYDK